MKQVDVYVYIHGRPHVHHIQDGSSHHTALVLCGADVATGPFLDLTLLQGVKL